MNLREMPVRTHIPVGFSDLLTVTTVSISLSKGIDCFTTQLMVNQYYWTEQISQET